MTEPTVAVENGRLNNWLQQVIKLADVEAIVNVDCAEAPAERVAREVGLPLVPLRSIDEAGSASAWTCHPADLPRPNNFSKNGPVAAQSAADIWQAVAVGDLTPESLSATKGNEFFRPYRPTTSDQVARAQIGGNTLLERTVDWFGEVGAVNPPGSHSTVLAIVAEDDFDNCLTFWNVRALGSFGHRRSPFIVLPGTEIEHWIGIGEAFRHLLVRPAEFEPDVTILCYGAARDLVAGATMALGLVRASTTGGNTGHTFPTPPNRQAPFTYTDKLDTRQFSAFERDYGIPGLAEAHVFENGPSRIQASEAPVPFRASVRCLLRLEGEPLDPLPRRPEVAKLLAESAAWHRDSIQMPIRVWPGAQRHDMTVPRLAEAVEAILRDHTSAFELSDKGKVASSLIARTDPVILLGRGIYEVIVDLTTPQSKELLREFAKLRAEGSSDSDLLELASVWGGRSGRRIRHASELQGTLTSAGGGTDALDNLSRVGWARRGFEIVCPACTLTSFVPMAAVVGDSTCPGCGLEVSYSRAGPRSVAPSVCYQLDSLVDRASDQGVIPHLLAVAALRPTRRILTFWQA